MFNSVYNICSIVVLIALLFSLVFRKTTKGWSNTLFLHLICITIIVAASDICSSVYKNGDIEHNFSNVLFQIICNYVYFFLRNFTTPLYLLFIMSVMGVLHKLKRGTGLFYLWAVPYLIDVVLLVMNLWNHKVFYYDEAYNYNRGPFMTILYVVAFYYIIMTMTLLIIYRKMLRIQKLIMLMLFVPFNAAAVVVGFVLPGLRLEIFATTMLTLVVTIGVQRPEEQIDEVVGINSYNSFLENVQKGFVAGRPMSVILIKITNHRALRNNLGLETYCRLIKNTGDRLEQISEVMGLHVDNYYLDRACYAVVGNAGEEDKLHDFARIMFAYLQEPMRIKNLEISVESRVCIVKIPHDMNDFTLFSHFAVNFHTLLPEYKHVVVLSDVSDTKQFKILNSIDALIYRAIKNKKFEMYYQPIYNTATGTFTSAEALIRLNTPEYGFISPALFIPAAENSGAIHKIGDFVLEDVARFMSERNVKDLGVEYVELNLSVAQCVESNIVGKIESIMNQYHIDSGSINLEITETAVDYDPEQTVKNIKALADEGYTFSLDDYGTGYSNTKRIVTLPLDIVKLDKSFVDEIDNPQMWIVIENTVRMLKRMNKKILVEGVESKRILDIFTDFGCDYIQGFYFSKPIPENEYIEFLKEHNGRSMSCS